MSPNLDLTGLEPILTKYGFNGTEIILNPIGTGLINHTWKVEDGDRSFILQRINETVFKQPLNLAANLQCLGEYVERNHPDYPFIRPVKSAGNEEMVFLNGMGYYRLFPFVPGSHTVEVVSTAEQAFEAAVQFARYARILSGLDPTRLRLTIPSFHDLPLRYRQWEEATKNGNPERINRSKDLIVMIHHNRGLIDYFEKIRRHPSFRLRAMHHDTKISNVLFDQEEKGICVIDLDTTMPGYFISDVGDMMRTYLCPVGEEEHDLNLIEVRQAFYEAIRQGYLQEMKDVLSRDELDSFFYAGEFMIYMQAIRFLTDYLNDDRYYGGQYPDQNYYRALNQLCLLKRYQAFGGKE